MADLTANMAVKAAWQKYCTMYQGQKTIIQKIVNCTLYIVHYQMYTFFLTKFFKNQNQLNYEADK
jgi:hypothetical protein